MNSTPGDRRARRQAARAEARRAEERRSSAPRWLLPGLIAVAVAVAAVLAIVLPGAGQPGTGGSSTVAPSASSGASGGAASVDAPVIAGTALPDFQGPTGDAAIGRPAPEVTGADFGGSSVAIDADGRPKVVVFLAHWCPHCQAEVPLIQSWVGGGGVPDGVDLVSVATGIRADAPNYPPDAWLQREGWTVPVIVDPSDTVAAAYGLTSYPFWVFIGPDGTVRARVAGELPITDLEATIRALTAT